MASLLLPRFGVRDTIWIAAAINLAIGLAAFLIDLKAVEVHHDVGDRVTAAGQSNEEFNSPLPQAVLTGAP